MRAVLFLVVLAVLTVLFHVPHAFADKPGPPMTYTKTSPNGKYVFVMLSPNTLEAEVKIYNDDAAKTVRAIRTMYAKSGLYKNDGSRELLWSVDWHRGSVVVPSDGVHLVTFNYVPSTKARKGDPIAKEELEQEAVTFFANGKQVRRYSLAELVERPEELARTVSHIRWMKENKLLDPAQQFEVSTTDGSRILFDLKTGDILKKERITPKE